MARGVRDAGHIGAEGRPPGQLQFLVQEAHVERRVVDDDLGAPANSPGLGATSANFGLSFRNSLLMP